MAFPHPNGISCFLRSALKTSHFDATDEASFYKHALVELVQNRAFGYGPQSTYKKPQEIPINGTWTHRSGFNVYQPDHWSNKVGVFDVMTVTHGPKNSTTYRYKIGLNNNANELYDYWMGFPKACFIPVPLPTENERFMHFDLVTSIRAIYLPFRFKTGEAFPELCSYLTINFRLSREINMIMIDWVGNYSYPTLPTLLGGLPPWANVCLTLDIPELYGFLGVPEEIRNKTVPLFEKGIIHYTWASDVAYATPILRHIQVRDQNSVIDIAHVVSAHQGIQFQYIPVPPRSTFLRDLLKNALVAAIGFIPGIGPLLAFGTELVFQAITNPDLFQSENLALLGPALVAAAIGSYKSLGTKNLSPKVLPSSTKLQIGSNDEVEAADGTDTGHQENIGPSMKLPSTEQMQRFVDVMQYSLNCHSSITDLSTEPIKFSDIIETQAINESVSESEMIISQAERDERVSLAQAPYLE